MLKQLYTLLLAVLLLPMYALAENSTHADGYTIHHNALPVTTLSPDIATHYGLIRSKYRGMLTISVIRDIAGTTGEAVPAKISVNATNLLGKSEKITLREIREDNAIYYIGEFPIIDRETVSFQLQVTPQGHPAPIKAHLSQQFFIE